MWLVYEGNWGSLIQCYYQVKVFNKQEGVVIKDNQKSCLAN